MQPVTQAEFDQKLTSGIALAVDFFAEWCGPCKMLSPVIESLAPEFEGKLDIVKVDIDAEQDLAQKYGVTSIPTIVFFKGGEEVGRMVGFQSKESLQAKFNSVATS
jgi:thioredoxin 1